MKTFTKDSIPTLTATNVERVYSGKPGCMCGCNGKYYDNGPMINKVLNILKNDPRTKIQDGYILYIDEIDLKQGERNYVVYLKQQNTIKYVVTVGGGLGPHVWDKDIVVEAYNIREALNIVEAQVAHDGGFVVSIEQAD